MRFFRVLLLLCCLTAGSVAAQGFQVTVSCSQSKNGSMRLVLYDGDSTSQNLSGIAQGNDVLFNGTVSKPTLAEIRRKNSQPLYFYIENSNINIDYNAANPSTSRITGSRTNSQFRYLLEQCGGDSKCLKLYVKQNPSLIYSPFLLAHHLWNDNDGDLLPLFDSLQGDATHTYHYHLLKQRLSRLKAVTIGQQMPNFIYHDGKEISFDTLYSHHPEWKGKYIALLVSATWCEQCQRIEQQLKAMTADTLTPLAYHTIQIDRSPQGWDSPFITELSIPMIPYIILLDADHRIIGRDVRIWELPKYLKGSSMNSTFNSKK